MKALIAKLQLDATCAMGAIWMYIDAQAARIAELENAIHRALKSGRGTSGRIILEASDEQDLRSVLTAESAHQITDIDKLREAIHKLQFEDAETDYKDGYNRGVRAAAELAASTALQAPVREVPEGWEFNAADFSLKAAGKSNTGNASLIRDLAGRAAWHALDDDGKDSTPLYIYGDGETISDAIADAVKRIPASNKEQA